MKTRKLNMLVCGLSFYSTVANAQWVKQASGFSVPSGILGLSVVNQNEVWACGSDTSQTATSVGLYTKTSNGGTTWTAGSIPGTSGMISYGITSVSIDTAWTILNDVNNGGGSVYRTNNGGTSWTKQATAAFTAPDGYPDFIYFFDSNNGVCVGDPNGGYFEIYTTSNGGTTWTRVASNKIPANVTNEYTDLGMYTILGNTIWFGTNKGQVYKSIDKGANWTKSAIGSNYALLAFKDANNGLACDGYAIYKTSDGGSSWSSVTFTGNIFDYDLSFAPGTTPAYISNGQGSSYSIDNGVTWIDIDSETHYATEFMNTVGTPLGWSGSINASSSSGGIYKWNSVFDGINSYELSENSVEIYPNPFNDFAHVVIKNPATLKNGVTFTLFDVTGRKVMLEENISAPRFNINRNSLDNGIYYYTIHNASGLIGKGKLVIN